VEVLRRDVRRDVSPPQADVKVGVLGAKELHNVQRAVVGAAEGPEKHRLAVVAEARDDERRDPAACADVLLPCGEKVEALIGRYERAAGLKTTPERLRRRHGIEHFDRGDRAGAPEGSERHGLLSGLIADCNIHLGCAAAGRDGLSVRTGATLANNYQ
jgi:hypothetical protein